MIKIKIPNLKFKEQRTGKILETQVFPIPTFNVIQWTKFGNSIFGPNYLITDTGEVIQLLPDEYRGTSHEGQLVSDEVISIFCGETKEAKESLKRLTVRWGRKDPSSEATERSDVAKVSTKTKSKKGKGKKG